MKTIGLLHGMGSVATVDYYRRINDRVNELRGGHERAELVLSSVNFGDIERFVRGEQWDAAGEHLASRARSLQAAGADFLALGSNTMHRVAPAIEAAVDLPLVHIVDVLAEEALSRGMHTLGLLGTLPVMEADFYAERLSLHGLEVVAPSAPDRVLVDRTIFDELTRHRFTAASRAEYARITRDLAEAGADAVVLGCTEIILLLDQATVPEVPLLDTTTLHVEAIVTRALGDSTP